MCSSINGLGVMNIFCDVKIKKVIYINELHPVRIIPYHACESLGKSRKFLNFLDRKCLILLSSVFRGANKYMYGGFIFLFTTFLSW
jgi:hypothetical protein